MKSPVTKHGGDAGDLHASYAPLQSPAGGVAWETKTHDRHHPILGRRRRPSIHPFWSWLLVAGMASSALYVVFVMATFMTKEYYDWETKMGKWIGKHLVKFYARICIEFLRTGAPMVVFTLCGVIYVHKSPGFLTSSGGAMHRLRLRLKQPTLYWTRWFSLGELIFLAFVLVLVPIWTYQLALYRFRVEDMIEGTKLSQWIEFLGRGFGTAGYLAGFFMLFPVARGAFWMKLVHTSYDQTVKYHRWLSRVMIACFIIHSLMYYIAWWMRGTWTTYAFPSPDYIRACVCDMVAAQKKECLCERHIRHTFQNIYGLISCLLLIVIWATSLAAVRRKSFELFYYSHFLFIPAFYLGVIHRESFGFYWYPGFILYMIARVKIGVTMARHVVVNEAHYCEESGLFSIEIQRSTRAIDQFAAGQYLFINVPALSSIQSHPFSISSAPGDNHSSLTIHGKVLGDWTRRLACLIQESKTNGQPLVIKADGYYGNPRQYSVEENVVLIAGGIGVTPAMSILRDCYNAYLADPQMAPKTVQLHWVVSSKAMTKPFLAILQEIARHQSVFQITIYVTNSASSDVAPLPLDASAMPPLLPVDQSKKAAGPLQPRKLTCWQDAILHGGVWLVSYLSVLLLWFSFLTVFANQKRPEKYRWYYMRILEPLLFFGFGTLYTYLVFSRVKINDTVHDKESVLKEQQHHVGLPVVHGEEAHDGGGHIRYLENERPDVTALLTGLHAQSPDAVFKVFLAGPMGLHDAAQMAIKQVADPSVFDIHFDQYEL